MTIINDLNQVMNEQIEFNSFAEEVTVISETKSGQNYSLYTVTNKNGSTLQNVPGGSGIQDKGILGFINGDKTRPSLIGITAPATNTTSAASAPSWTVADIT